MIPRPRPRLWHIAKRARKEKWHCGESPIQTLFSLRNVYGCVSRVEMRDEPEEMIFSLNHVYLYKSIVINCTMITRKEITAVIVLGT